MNSVSRHPVVPAFTSVNLAHPEVGTEPKAIDIRTPVQGTKRTQTQFPTPSKPSKRAKKLFRSTAISPETTLAEDSDIPVHPPIVLSDVDGGITAPTGVGKMPSTTFGPSPLSPRVKTHEPFISQETVQRLAAFCYRPATDPHRGQKSAMNGSCIASVPRGTASITHELQDTGCGKRATDASTRSDVILTDDELSTEMDGGSRFVGLSPRAQRKSALKGPESPRRDSSAQPMPASDTLVADQLQNCRCEVLSATSPKAILDDLQTLDLLDDILLTADDSLDDDSPANMWDAYPQPLEHSAVLTQRNILSSPSGGSRVVSTDTIILEEDTEDELTEALALRSVNGLYDEAFPLGFGNLPDHLSSFEPFTSTSQKGHHSIPDRRVPISHYNKATSDTFNVFPQIETNTTDQDLSNLHQDYFFGDEDDSDLCDLLELTTKVSAEHDILSSSSRPLTPKLQWNRATEYQPSTQGTAKGPFKTSSPCNASWPPRVVSPLQHPTLVADPAPVQCLLAGPPLPFTRPGFPRPVRDRSPIQGLRPDRPLRTCFRLGEALNAAAAASRSNSEVIIELYARVVRQTREGGSHHFRFADIFKPERPPFLTGTWVGWLGCQCWEVDVRGLLKERGAMCRVLGKITWNIEREWHMEILSAWKANWDDVAIVKGIVCA